MDLRSAALESEALKCGRAVCPEELAQLESSRDAETYRCVLWAAKQSAYGVVRKLGFRAAFVPGDFATRLGTVGAGHYEGVVLHALARRIRVWVDVVDDAVHAVAADRAGSSARLVAAVGSLGARECAAAAAGRLARATLASALEVGFDDLLLRGRESQVVVAGDGRRIDLSFSHHGRRIAVAADLLPEASRAPARC